MQLLFTDHVVDLIRINACCIDHIMGCQFTALSYQSVTILQFFDTTDSCIPLKLHTIFAGILSHGDGQLKWTDDSAGRCKKRCHHLIGYMRLQFQYLILFQNL